MASPQAKAVLGNEARPVQTPPVRPRGNVLPEAVSGAFPPSLQESGELIRLVGKRQVLQQAACTGDCSCRGRRINVGFFPHNEVHSRWVSVADDKVKEFEGSAVGIFILRG